MSTSARHRSGPQHLMGARGSLALAGLAPVVAVASAWLSLELASGVTRLSPTEHSTQFMEPVSYGVGSLLAMGLAVAAAVGRWYLGLAGLGAVVGVQLVMMTEVVRRYEASGWSDGLEVLAYLGPLAVLVLGALLVLVAGLVGRCLRARAAGSA